MTTKERAEAVKSLLFGINQIIYAATDFLEYGDENEHAIIEALNGIHQQTFAISELVKRIPF